MFYRDLKKTEWHATGSKSQQQPSGLLVISGKAKMALPEFT